MVKIIGLIACLLFVLLLTGCDALTADPQFYTPSNVAEKPVIQYMKDAKGNCYAYTGSKTVYGNVIFSISAISCERAGL